MHEYSTRHCTATKLQSPPTRTVVRSQCITNKEPQIWNYLSTELYTNTAHQTLIHVSGFSSRFRKAVQRLIKLLFLALLIRWAGLAEVCGMVQCGHV